MFKFTKPRDEQASFRTDCWKCRGELTVTNGRLDYHQCEDRPPATLDDIKF